MSIRIALVGLLISALATNAQFSGGGCVNCGSASPYQQVSCVSGVDETTVLQTALNTSNVTPVIIVGPVPCGISAGLIVPANGIVVGHDVNAYESYEASFTPLPPFPSTQARTIIYSLASFPNTGGSLITVGNYSYIQGLTLMGPAVSGSFTPLANLTVNCINLVGSRFASFRDVFANGCNINWDMNSPESQTEGPILTNVRGSLGNYGIYGYNVYDPQITGSNFNANYKAGAYFYNLSAAKLTANTFENTQNSGGTGIGLEIDNSIIVSITGNKFENNYAEHLRLNADNAVSVSGKDRKSVV